MWALSQPQNQGHSSDGRRGRTKGHTHGRVQTRLSSPGPELTGPQRSGRPVRVQLARVPGPSVTD